MSYDRANYAEVEPLAPGMHFLREELACQKLGLTVLDADEGWEGLEHDHAEDGEEELYLLVDGSCHLTVDGEQLSLDAGDVVRVDPEATRQLSFDDESTMVIAGAQ